MAGEPNEPGDETSDRTDAPPGEPPTNGPALASLIIGIAGAIPSILPLLAFTSGFPR